MKQNRTGVSKAKAEDKTEGYNRPCSKWLKWSSCITIAAGLCLSQISCERNESREAGEGTHWLVVGKKKENFSTTAIKEQGRGQKFEYDIEEIIGDEFRRTIFVVYSDQDWQIGQELMLVKKEQ